MPLLVFMVRPEQNAELLMLCSGRKNIVTALSQLQHTPAEGAPAFCLCTIDTAVIYILRHAAAVAAVAAAI
jgi:hypothetical protein